MTLLNSPELNFTQKRVFLYSFVMALMTPLVYSDNFFGHTTTVTYLPDVGVIFFGLVSPLFYIVFFVKMTVFFSIIKNLTEASYINEKNIFLILLGIVLLLQLSLFIIKHLPLSSLVT